MNNNLFSLKAEIDFISQTITDDFEPLENRVDKIKASWRQDNKESLLGWGEIGNFLLIKLLT